MVAEENKKAIEAINQRLDIMESKITSYNHQNIINSLEHSPTPIIDPFMPNNERHGCTVICDDDASMIAMPKKKQKKNICIQYIKDDLTKEYSREELAKGRNLQKGGMMPPTRIIWGWQLYPKRCHLPD